MTDAPRGSADGPGVGLSVLSAAAFGTVAVLAKTGYDAGAGPLPLLAVRFAVAAGLLFVLHAVRRRSPFVGGRDTLRLVLLGGLGYGFEASLFFTALTKAPAGVVSLVFFSYPLITVLLGFAFGFERPRPRLLVALGLGSVGILSIFSFSDADPAGLILALGAAAAVAVYFLLAEVVMRGVDPAASATWTSLGAGLAVGAAALVSGQEFPMAALGPAALLGAATVLAFVFLYAAIARIGSPRAAIAQMLEPVVTVVLAALFLDEVVTLRIVIGAALIVSALPLLAGAGKPALPPAADSL